jgi:hypothetical protein
MMALVSKTSRKGASARFPKSGTPGGVKVSPGKGGVNIGTPKHCESKRAAPNVKATY